LSKMSDDIEEKPEPAVPNAGPEPSVQDAPKIEDATDVMFRNVVSTHVDFTFIGDHKAYVMIYVNSIIIGVFTTFAIPKIEAHPLILFPMAIACLFCLISLSLSILAIRPILGTGTTTRQAILDRKANILFFGNYHGMSLEDFEWSMHQLLENDDALVSNMIRDVYYLGKGLGAKYRLVRASYTVFMYGMIISVISFLSVVTYMLYSS